MVDFRQFVAIDTRKGGAMERRGVQTLQPCGSRLELRIGSWSGAGRALLGRVPGQSVAAIREQRRSFGTERAALRLARHMFHKYMKNRKIIKLTA